jgi:hypothetical protein
MKRREQGNYKDLMGEGKQLKAKFPKKKSLRAFWV